MLVAAGIVAVAVAAGCHKNNRDPAGPSWPISSADLKEGQPVDVKFTCDGADLSPALAWPPPPTGTQSLALIMDDPDAPSGTFTHWLLYDVPADRTSVAQGVEKTGEVRGLGRQGQNGFEKLGYGGPCPPPGKPHHYRFTLHALSAKLDLAAGANRAAVDKALAGKVLAQTQLTVTYQRAAKQEKK